MQTWRFVEAAPAPDSPRYFCHFLFPAEDPGFQLARSVLQSMQARRLPAVSPHEIFRGGAGVLRLAWFRWVHSRLFIPSDAPSHLQLDMEQRPIPSNCVRLGERVDRYGRAVASVHWRVSAEDRVDMSNAAARFLSLWPSTGSQLTSPASHDNVDISLKPHNAFHPVGTCRLGSDRAAVVGLDLRVKGTDNLSVLSTGVFPNSGSANPTFSLLCFAEMLAERVAVDTQT